MNRIKAVQRALNGRVKRVYLEIGVSRGVAFRRITADEKIAVDPAFKLSARSRRLADAKAGAPPTTPRRPATPSSRTRRLPAQISSRILAFQFPCGPLGVVPVDLRDVDVVVLEEGGRGCG
jgi:hypothetical protein